MTEPHTAGLLYAYANITLDRHRQRQSAGVLGRTVVGDGERPAFMRLSRSLALVCIQSLTSRDQFARRPRIRGANVISSWGSRPAASQRPC